MFSIKLVSNLYLSRVVTRRYIPVKHMPITKLRDKSFDVHWCSGPRAPYIMEMTFVNAQHILYIIFLLAL